MKFSPVAPEIIMVEIETFGMTRQKLAYPTKYLRKYWTDLHQIFRGD